MLQRGEVSPKSDEALRQALRRTRLLWRDLIDLIIAKDRRWLAGQDTVDVDRLIDTRGFELSQAEAAVARLDKAKATPVNGTA